MPVAGFDVSGSSQGVDAVGDANMTTSHHFLRPFFTPEGQLQLDVSELSRGWPGGTLDLRLSPVASGIAIEDQDADFDETSLSLSVNLTAAKNPVGLWRRFQLGRDYQLRVQVLNGNDTVEEYKIALSACEFVCSRLLLTVLIPRVVLKFTSCEVSKRDKLEKVASAWYQ